MECFGQLPHIYGHTSSSLLGKTFYFFFFLPKFCPHCQCDRNNLRMTNQINYWPFYLNVFNVTEVVWKKKDKNCGDNKPTRPHEYQKKKKSNPQAHRTRPYCPYRYFILVVLSIYFSLIILKFEITVNSRTK